MPTTPNSVHFSFTEAFLNHFWMNSEPFCLTEPKRELGSQTKILTKEYHDKDNHIAGPLNYWDSKGPRRGEKHLIHVCIRHSCAHSTLFTCQLEASNAIHRFQQSFTDCSCHFSQDRHLKSPDSSSWPRQQSGLNRMILQENSSVSFALRACWHVLLHKLWWFITVLSSQSWAGQLGMGWGGSSSCPGNACHSGPLSSSAHKCQFPLTLMALT